MPTYTTSKVLYELSNGVELEFIGRGCHIAQTYWQPADSEMEFTGARRYPNGADSGVDYDVDAAIAELARDLGKTEDETIDAIVNKLYDAEEYEEPDYPEPDEE